MTWFSVAAGVGTAVLGYAGSKSAAKDQQAGLQASTDELARQFNLNRKDSARWREAGGQAVNRLAYLMGLPGAAQAGMSPLGAAPRREEFFSGGDPIRGRPGSWGIPGPITGYTNQVFDQEGFDNAVREWEAKKQAIESGVAADPDYGSLLQDYVWEEDPAYDFVRSEGEKAVMRRASAMKNRLSPATMKALIRFNDSNANTFYGEGFNRFMADKNFKFNSLANLAGIGNNANSQVMNSGTTIAGAIAGNAAASGAAAGAGTVGAVNSAIGGINNAYKGYMDNYWMNQIFGGNKGGTTYNTSTNNQADALGLR